MSITFLHFAIAIMFALAIEIFLLRDEVKSKIPLTATKIFLLTLAALPWCLGAVVLAAIAFHFVVVGWYIGLGF